MVLFAKKPSPEVQGGSGVRSTSTTPPRLDELPFPAAAPGFGNVDRIEAAGFEPGSIEADILAKVDDAVANERFELPHLATTHMKLLDLASNPDVDVKQVERLIAPDLALTASLLKTANSVMYGSPRQIDTIRGAIVRIGMSGLRSSLLSLSLRSVIFKGRTLTPIAEEIWRQSFSVANNARANAVPLALDPERMFVLGLLHDIGKVPLLHMLREFAAENFEFRRPFVGFVFQRHHEQVGRRLAATWNLPEEVVEVVGCHHDFGKNPRFSKVAALVTLSHKQDIHLSSGDADGYFGLSDDPAMCALDLPETMRKPLLDAVRVTYLRALAAV
jgi:putative nucleotidyltransferase with HDIG domain